VDILGNVLCAATNHSAHGVFCSIEMVLFWLMLMTYGCMFTQVANTPLEDLLKDF